MKYIHTFENATDRIQSLPGSTKVKTDIQTLWKIYNAGFEHGLNKPDRGTFEAFHRLINDESPLEDGTKYAIKENICIE